MSIKKLSPTEKAAILLLGFGEEISGEIFKELSPQEIKKIGATMNRMTKLNEQLVDEVMLEFYELLQTKSTFIKGGSDFTRKLLNKAFHPDMADSLNAEIGNHSTTIDAIEGVDPLVLARVLRKEHPQTIALVLAYADPSQAALTLGALPESLHGELITRLASLEAINPEIIETINDQLKEEISQMSMGNRYKLGGPKQVADILARLDKNTEEGILDALEERDPELSEEIRALMFTFDELVNIDHRGVQILLKNANPQLLMVALKSASEPVLKHFLDAMSQRAQTRFLEDLEALPPIRLSDSEAAQQEILRITKELEEKGELIIQKDDEQFV